MDLVILSFRDDDRPRLAGIRNANVPDEPRSVEQMSYWDRTWDASRYERVRLVAERDGRIVGGARSPMRPGASIHASTTCAWKSSPRLTARGSVARSTIACAPR
jgi:hypothetical protein